MLSSRRKGGENTGKAAETVNGGSLLLSPHPSPDKSVFLASTT